MEHGEHAVVEAQLRSDARVASFLEAARAYCAWAEGSPLEAAAEAREALHLLARLSAAALELPEPESLPVTDTTERGPSDEEWTVVFHRLASLPFKEYWEPWQPNDVSQEQADVAMGDVHDDLADVWRELTEGLRHWEAGEPIEAVWCWGFGYRNHWGLHLAGALWALHWWFDEDKSRWNSPPA